MALLLDSSAFRPGLEKNATRAVISRVNQGALHLHGVLRTHAHFLRSISEPTTRKETVLSIFNTAQ